MLNSKKTQLNMRFRGWVVPRGWPLLQGLIEMDWLLSFERTEQMTEECIKPKKQ